MPENASWFVVHTYSGYEKKVAATIEKTVENRKLHDLILEVSVPTEEVTELTADNKKKVVERKIFPGYVLVKMTMTDESWHAVRNTRGVTGFVGPGSRPVPLTDAEVAALGVEKHEIIVPYAAGDSVKIIDGPLNTFVGVVEEIELEKNRVRVVISLFGRETPVELELEQVEPLVV
ncbi:MAG: transcription termination/antitermination protein NusG [Oscillospiraceae bacterium]|jgi:transcriptional antiterminator NusG|nr:transcription termination/antitermination protein NusG [Oscillospiraceae bacterium]